MSTDRKKSAPDSAPPTYKLDDQVGFLLRRASQRHLSIFSRRIPELTSMQFAALARLHEAGALSQNALGRLTAMDGATIKGVVSRLARRDLVQTENDRTDRRRLVVSLTPQGRALIRQLIPEGHAVTQETLAPLSSSEQAVFLHLLRKLT